MLIFDVLLQNADRRRTNANFAVRGGQLMAFDHEHVASDTMLIGGAPDPLDILKDHWCTGEFGPSLRFVEEEVSWVKTLTDASIDSAVSAGQAIWPCADAPKIGTLIKTRRDSAAEWLARIKL